MRGLIIQLQVVYALLLRETKTRFGVSHLGYLWALIPCAVWILMFSGLYRIFGRLSPPGTSAMAFLTTGIVPFSAFRETGSRCLSSIEANKGLLFYPQVRPLDLVLARAVLEGATHLILLVLFLGGEALVMGLPRIDSILQTLLGLGLAVGLGASLGLLFCALSVYSGAVERIFGIITRIIFWTSGLFHPVESLPKAARDILLWNPVVHAVETVRDGWFPGYDARHVDPWYPLFWILVFSFFGLSVERMARRRLELS